MAELKEIQIGKDNLVVLSECIVRGGILPESAMELTRSVRVKHDAIVEGGTYAETLDVDDGPTEFRGAVYANKEVHVKTSAHEPIVFRKAVASADTVSAYVADGRVLFGADINAATVRLRHCYVGGSVYASDVELEDCVVLGGVFASRKATFTNVMVGTFHAPEVFLSGIDYLLYPTAFSVEPMTVLPGAQLSCLSLADLGALFKGEPEDPDSGRIALDLAADSQRTVLVDDDGSQILVNSYSVSTRVLASDLASTDRLENHFLISAGALGTQLLKTYALAKEDGSRSEELSIENIAEFLFSVLDGRTPVRELSSHVSFDELRERFA